MPQVTDSISVSGEFDWFRLDLIGSLRDPAVFLADSQGRIINWMDDSFALGSDPLLQFRAPSSGTYYLGVGDLTGGVGTYTLVFDQAGVPSPISPPPPGATF